MVHPCYPQTPGSTHFSLSPPALPRGASCPGWGTSQGRESTPFPSCPPCCGGVELMRGTDSNCIDVDSWYPLFPHSGYPCSFFHSPGLVLPPPQTTSLLRPSTQHHLHHITERNPLECGGWCSVEADCNVDTECQPHEHRHLSLHYCWCPLHLFGSACPGGSLHYCWALCTLTGFFTLVGDHCPLGTSKEQQWQ